MLAAGYATRLRPLTDQVAKPLLPLAGRPMLDYLYDRIAEVGARRRAPCRDELPLRCGLPRLGGGRRATVAHRRPRRRHDVQRRPARGCRRHGVRDRARWAPGRGSPGAGRGQLDRLRARRARLVLAGEGRRGRNRRAPGGRRRAHHPVRGGRARRGRSRRLARGEALAAAQRPRGHRVIRVLGEARLLDPDLSRRGAIHRTRRATSSSGSTPASRCTATASPATGWTSATRSSSSSRTT